MTAAALPRALSCLDSGADVTLALRPTSTPSCPGSTLGVPPVGCSRITLGLLCQPGRGSREAFRFTGTGTSTGTGMRSAQDGFQEGLLLIKAWRSLSWEHHSLFPKGTPWAGVSRSEEQGWKPKELRREGLSIWSGKGPRGDNVTGVFWMEESLRFWSMCNAAGAPGAHCRASSSLGALGTSPRIRLTASPMAVPATWASTPPSVDYLQQ